MENAFYDDPDLQTSDENLKPMKRPTTLEFGPNGQRRKPSDPVLLNADDVAKCKLITPEMERFLKDSFGNDSPKIPVPAPPKFSGENVTGEQEEFAKDFTNAIAVYHQIGDANNQELITGITSRMEDITCSSNALPTTVISALNYAGQLPVSRTSSASTTIVSATVKPFIPTFLPGNPFSTVGDTGDNGYSNTLTVSILPKGVLAKEELQTVPSDSSSMGISPPISPIDLEEQERIKIERKRYRNRVAATKCRQKKLQKIAQLENTVKEQQDEISNLKDENNNQSNVIAQLRSEIFHLKGIVFNHVKDGCKIMIVHDQ